MAFKPKGTFDYSTLKGILTNAKIATTNNALYQVLSKIIDGIVDNKSNIDGSITNVTSVEARVAKLEVKSKNTITLYEFDTNLVIPVVDLAGYCNDKGFVIFKDISGNALVNNITFTGTVDGSSPVININWGVLRIYTNDNANYHEW